MAEKKGHKHKKLSSIWREIQWTAKGLFVVILILLILFRGPLKVVALLAIIIAAITILPKRYRKWFWLTVGAGAVCLIIWCFIPEDDTGWYPYTFDEEIAALKAKYEVPDEKNAALLYAELFENLDIETNQPDFFTKSDPSSQNGPWLSKNHPGMAEWLDNYSDTITELLRISRMEKCFFPINFSSPEQSQYMANFRDFRNCSYLLIFSANNDAAEDRIETALGKFVSLLRISKHIKQQPGSSSFLAGTAFEALGLSAINRFIVKSDLTNQQLHLISELIKPLEDNWTKIWPDMLDYEKLCEKNNIARGYFERNSQGKSRLIRRSAQSNRRNQIQNPTTIYTRRIYEKFKIILAWPFLPSSPEKISEVVDNYFEKYYSLAEPDFNWNTTLEDTIQKLRLNYRDMIENLLIRTRTNYWRNHEIYLRYLSGRKGSRWLIAIKEYKNTNGRWPQNLYGIIPNVDENMFIDPINNNSFVYKLTDDGFVFYSKGVNTIDDDGQHTNTSNGPDDRPIWPQ